LLPGGHPGPLRVDRLHAYSLAGLLA
jgi:hypothetical protein